MNILHTVEYYEPSKGGAQEVVRQLSERMVGYGHNVTVATTMLPDRREETINGVKIKEFNLSGNKVRGYKGDIEGYKRFLVDSKFDIVMNYAAQQWATDIFFEVIDSIESKKVIVPCGFSGLYDKEYKDYFRNMPVILRKYNASIYLSNCYRDIEFAKKNNISNLHVIPNGAGKDEFLSSPSTNIRKTYGIENTDFLILSVGTHTGLKGHLESMEMYKNSNIPNSRLVIIGNSIGDGCISACLKKSRLFTFRPSAIMNNKRILVLDLDRDDTISLMKSADLFLFPSNIEASPIVLFESCASKTPFLATDVGNSKEIAEWTGGGRILPTYKDKLGYSHVDTVEGARLLEELYIDDELRTRLSKSGFKSWKMKYNWEEITNNYLDLYRELLQT